MGEWKTGSMEGWFLISETSDVFWEVERMKTGLCH
jgi:hypothetical protein